MKKIESRYAYLAPAHTPVHCSQEAWLAWFNSPQYNPCLARDRLDDYVAELNFTGRWTGPGWEMPCFFEVTVTHPHHPGGAWRFETYAEAHQALGTVLKEAHRRAEEELPGIS
jgi:hypothetical protein